MFSSTGLSPSTADHPRPLRLTHGLSLLLPSAEGRNAPQHRTHNPRRVSHAHGLAILRFRSPLLTESQLFSLPTGTEMFHFPALPPHPIYSAQGDTTSLVPGFPIRTSSDPRSVDSSPRHIAASHVLHRLSVPRHPPCALKHLQHKKPKNFELKNSEIAHQTTPAHPSQTPKGPTRARPLAASMLATTIHKSNTTPHHQSGATTSPIPGFPHSGRRDSGPVVSKPNSVSDEFPAPLSISRPRDRHTFVVHPNPTHYRHGPSHDSPRSR